MTPWRRRSRARTVGAACLALASVASTAATATYCDAIGESAPEVVTLLASTKNPQSEGWVLQPDCSFQTVRVDRQAEGSFKAKSLGIQRVVSVPSGASSVDLQGNPLSRGADLSMAQKATSVVLSAVPTDLRSLRFPPGVTQIWFMSTPNGELDSLDGIQFPTNLYALDILGSGLTSLKNVQIPSTVAYLTIQDTPLTAVDFALPAALDTLSFTRVPLKTGSLERLSLPSKLGTFEASECGSINIRGIKWPASLHQFLLRSTEITGFEIRASDVKIFEGLEAVSAQVPTVTCNSPAEPQVTKLGRICVLSDADFESLYGTSVVSPTPVSPGSPGSTQSPTKPKASSGGSKASKAGSSDGNTEGSNGIADTSSSLQEDGSTLGGAPSLKKGSQSAGSSFDLSLDATSSEIGSAGGSQTTSNNRTPSPKGSANKPSTAPGTSSSSGSTGTIIGIVMGSVIVAVAACGVIVRTKKRRERRGKETHDGTTGTHEGTGTLNTSFDDYASNAPQMLNPLSSEFEVLGVDFRNDMNLVRSRIDQVTVGRQIARGGYGIVYRGSYQGRVVAIKQMLPDAWRNDSMVADFVDEIRMCARLKHEKIVEFIGVSWTGVRDLSVVTEFMAGGDLHSVIRKYPESSGREWTRPWTSSNLRNKTLIAIDVAEAVVYMHSLSPAVIHRDLKSKNVLLDLVGNAKLSDFGISRTVTVDETMTSEVGTAAWIAPEVLRGERYSEKADIYSLGVLLVELDRCSHPYANEPVLLMGSLTPARGAPSRANTSHVAHKNTQIAVLVSTGQLRPSTSEGCPEGIAALVTRCLSFDAGDRPTPIEVVYQLHQIRRTHEET